MFPEYAFLGRSNVGKSSLINMITNFGKLAKTSGSPGKTQLINHFLINKAWYLTDLPGYGFAKVPLSVKRRWEKMIKDYMLNRPNLVSSFILIDVRHSPLKNDLEFLKWAGANQLPFTIVFTKADKLGRSKLQQNLAEFERVLFGEWDPLPPCIVSSSKDRRGRDEILDLIEQWNRVFLQ